MTSHTPSARRHHLLDVPILSKADAHHLHPYTRQRLHVVRWLALVDLVLFVALMLASRLNVRPLVSVLGPIHGGNVLLLVVIIYTGVTDALWHWAFVAITILTGGPLGALVGEVIVSRRLNRHHSRHQNSDNSYGQPIPIQAEVQP
ncbi:MAG: hypothetical protein AAF267_09200 [Deinococcota bacterium]